MINFNRCPLWLVRLFPFLRWRHTITGEAFKADTLAAATGALIVLPQAVAFASIAGLPPAYGLYTAMIPTVVAALWGSSRHMVSGPTTAISIVVFASISPLAEPGSPSYIGLVLTLTLLSGVMQLAMGLARLGVLVNFISPTVILGFTAGAAILIAASQAPQFFGLDISDSAHFHEVLIQCGARVGDTQPWVAVIGVVTLVAAILSKRYLPKLPYMVAGMAAGAAAAAVVHAFYGSAQTGIRTIGALMVSFPPLSMADLSISAIRQTLFPATVIAILALTQAVAIARSLAARSDQRSDSNQEFIGQGLSNIAASFFSGYATSGSFNRSAANFAAGARSPLAAVLSAVFLLLITLLIAPLVAFLPVPAIAAILFIVAWELIDFRNIRIIARRHKRERIVLAVTFVGTLVDMEKGIFFGILVALIIYLYRTSQPSIHELVPSYTDRDNPRRKFLAAGPETPKCPQLAILHIEGSIFFGAAEHVQQHFRDIDETDPMKKHLLLTAHPIGFMDLAGAELLAREGLRRRKMGGGLYIVGAQPDLRAMLRRSGQIDTIGEEWIFHHKGDAIRAIYARLDAEICRCCTARIFRECHDALPDGSARESAG